MVLPLKILLKPLEVLKEMERVSFYSALLYAFILASIGSILSFISLYLFEKENLIKVVSYSILIYVLDIMSVFLFAYYLKKFKAFNFKKAFVLTTFATTPVWLSDIVDIYQPLRPLSTLGLIYAVYILHLWFKELGIRKYLFPIAIYVILYFLNAIISEAIFKNPLLKNILNTSLRSVLIL